MSTMIGKRRDLSSDDGAFEVGEYGKYRGHWLGMTPNGLLAGLGRHEITEHEDGTITVSPSILVTSEHQGKQWHGYLERGVWREV